MSLEVVSSVSASADNFQDVPESHRELFVTVSSLCDAGVVNPAARNLVHDVMRACLAAGYLQSAH